MHRTLIISSLLVVYFGLAVYGLYSFEAGLLVTSVVLYGIPAALLAHFTRAPGPVLLSVASFGAGLAIFLEGLAHENGLWYSLSAANSRFFSIIPLELIVSTMFSTLFLVLLYEVLFDDRAFTVRSARERMGYFLAFIIAAAVVVFFHTVLTPTSHDPYAYVWIVITLLGANVMMVALHKQLTIHFFDRLIDFALIGMIPLAMGLWLAIENTHKVFAYPDYIATLSFFGQTVPIEELFLLFVIPLTIATVYELYLDDRA